MLKVVIWLTAGECEESRLKAELSPGPWAMTPAGEAESGSWEPPPAHACLLLREAGAAGTRSAATDSLWAAPGQLPPGATALGIWATL